MPRRLMLFFLAFGAWLGLLVLVMSLEHSSVGKAAFASPAASTGYLALQGTLTVVAIVLGGWSLVRGPNSSRAMVILPLVILALYGAMLVAGPG